MNLSNSGLIKWVGKSKEFQNEKIEGLHIIKRKIIIEKQKTKAKSNHFAFFCIIKGGKCFILEALNDKNVYVCGPYKQNEKLASNVSLTYQGHSWTYLGSCFEDNPEEPITIGQLGNQVFQALSEIIKSPDFQSNENFLSKFSLKSTLTYYEFDVIIEKEGSFFKMDLETL